MLARTGSGGGPGLRSRRHPATLVAEAERIAGAIPVVDLLAVSIEAVVATMRG